MRSSLGLVVAGSWLMAGCTGASSGSNSGVGVSSYDVNKYAVNKLACNPIGTGTATSNPNQGVQASLWYLKSGETIYHDVADMIENGHLSDKQIFFSSVNVPTRYFTAGFPLETGGMIQDDQGHNLVQYFAMRFTSTIQLGPNDPEGDYEFGLISDDGAIWYMSEDGSENFSITVNNDGDHPAQLGCGPIVHMTKNTRLTSRLDYYQGPPTEIALLPIWRLRTAGMGQESMCGQNGNQLYFDPLNNSAIEPAYQSMQNRGWKPLNESNYFIPATADYNPCTSGTAPVISSLVADNILDGSYAVLWTTDIAATDQVMYTDTSTNIQQLTTSDNVLRLNHSIRLVNLVSHHTYTIQAVSVSADLGKTISAPISITIP